MDKIKSGFAFHVHHDNLVEFCFDYDARAHFIKNHKPKKEQKLRLRLFKLIPKTKIPNALIKAQDEYNRAQVSYAIGGDGETYDRATGAYRDAWETSRPQLVKLHKVLCPDCAWNGRTIFPKETK